MLIENGLDEQTKARGREVLASDGIINRVGIDTSKTKLNANRE